MLTSVTLHLSDIKIIFCVFSIYELEGTLKYLALKCNRFIINAIRHSGHPFHTWLKTAGSSCFWSFILIALFLEKCCLLFESYPPLCLFFFFSLALFLFLADFIFKLTSLLQFLNLKKILKLLFSYLLYTCTKYEDPHRFKVHVNLQSLVTLSSSFHQGET